MCEREGLVFERVWFFVHKNQTPPGEGVHGEGRESESTAHLPIMLGTRIEPQAPTVASPHSTMALSPPHPVAACMKAESLRSHCTVVPVVTMTT